MEFSNLSFLYLLLPISLLVYFAMPDIRKKNIVLIVISLLIYGMGQPVYVLLIALLSFLNYYFALGIRRDDPSSMIIPVALNILILALFKYLDFFLGIFGLVSEDGGFLLGMVKNMVKGLNSIGFAFQEPRSVVPLGLSFYTFQVISYMVDVYREKIKAETSFVNMLLYLTMFPKMLQGPIARYEQIAPQITGRKTNPRLIFEGAQRFIFGLAKKVLLADYAGKVISELATMNADLSFVGAWLGAIMFTFQIYFDFSGYTDMAIGLGKILGFKYPENFDLPYTATSITEFWRRWHMSLSYFFRDYVYIPLGGNRKGTGRQILNMLVVWGLTGLWHGASWNFVIWGLYYFALLAVEKQIMPLLERIPKIGRVAITMFLTIFGWVIFSHTDMGSLGSSLAAMFGFGEGGFASAGVGTKLLNTLPLIIVCAIGSSPIPRGIGVAFSSLTGMVGKRRAGLKIRPKKLVYVFVTFAVMCVLLWLCTVSLVGSTSAPAIYGNF